MDSWTAFMLGLVGSLHCAGMCGPLALALPRGGRPFGGCLTGRLAYNFGRIVTYTIMGVVFGSVGQALLMAGIQRWVSIGLGMLLIGGLLVSKRASVWPPITRAVDALKAQLGLRLRQPSVGSLAAVGLLNGLLPCGLVYVAAAGATATGGVVSGAQYMAAFGLGTIPMMLAISLSGSLVPMQLRLRLRKAIPITVFLLGTLLILRGMSLGIPFLSPDISEAGTACCHR